ncbi:MAG: MFS transporter [Desulfobacterales bacterium]
MWVYGSGKTGKKLMWLTSMALNTGAFFGVFCSGPEMNSSTAYWCFYPASDSGQRFAAIPSAIQADVIDYDELITGQRREGLYIGFWSIAKKLAAAVGRGRGPCPVPQYQADRFRG